MKLIGFFGISASAIACAAIMSTASPAAAAGERPREGVALGRYLVQTAGCNDCHSPGYASNAGQTPEATWLTGDGLGWRGPWGTTYATNLRLFVVDLSQDEWLRHVRSMQPRPPMPWFNMHAMSDRELRTIYRYLKAAGPAGQPAPPYLAPGQAAAGPVVQFPSARARPGESAPACIGVEATSGPSTALSLR